MNAIEVIRLDGLEAEFKQLQARVVEMLGELRGLRKGVRAELNGGVVSKRVTEGEVVGMIQGVVAQYFSLETARFKSRTRVAYVAWPRQVAMAFVYEMTVMSLGQIGELFGGRDHGTVLHAGWRVRDRMEVEPKAKLEVLELREAVVKAITRAGWVLPENPRKI